MATAQPTNGELREGSLQDFPSSVMVVALSVLVVASFLFFWRWGYPYEDAAMLFTYSENIAKGAGVVYNPGGVAVDGASDLLLAIVLAALRFAGLPVEIGAAFVNAVSLGFIGFAIGSTWKRSGFGGRWAAPGAIVVLLATTPIFVLGATGFGTLFFAALVTLVALLAIRLKFRPTFGQLAVVGGAVAIAGMDRIEGFALGGAVVFAHSVATRSLRTLFVPAGVAVSVALVWFAWRWSYFGYPLPNPFYKKGGLNLSSGMTSVRYVSALGAPWLLVQGVGVLTKGARRHALSYALLVIVPWTALWILLSNEMNLGGRFQFPVVPVAAVLSSVIATQLAANEPKHSRATTLRIAVVAVGLMAVISGDLRLAELTVLRDLRQGSFQEQVADALQKATGGSGSLVTTEAGMVAWKTDLQVTDLWGLNDKRIAHDGLLVPSEIADIQPDLLFSHPVKLDFLTEGVTSTSAESWQRMNAYLFCFAQTNGYEPIAVWNLNGEYWVIHAAVDAVFKPVLRQLLAEIERKGERADTSGAALPFINDCPQS